MPKTIGNRKKRLCVRLEDKHRLRKSSKSTNQSGKRNAFPNAFLICAFQSADFLRWCYPPSATSRTISFSIPLVLGIKGSVERSLFPSAIFLIFARNKPWKSENHLCTLFSFKMSKERLEKSDRTPPVSWRPWALAYSRDRPYNFLCLSAMSKNGRLRSFFSRLWV